MGRRFFLAVLLPLVAAAAACCAETPIEAGRKALEEQRYADAVRYFREAAAGEPTDYAAHFHLGLALSLLGNQDPEAIATYRKTLELKPDLYEAQLNLGILHLRQKQPQPALPLLEAAAAKKPDQFRPVYYLAEALAMAGRPADAEPKYQASLALDPKSAASQAGWGRAALQQDKLADAAVHLRAAAALDPSYSDGLLELASIYEKRKLLDEAAAIYREFPANPAAQERLGGLLLETGKPEEAVTVLEPVVAKSPTAANRYALATAYLRTKQTEKAVASLQQAVAADPRDMDLRLVLGRLLRDQKQYPAAAQEFFRVVQARPDAKEAWSELAGILILMENYPQALAALDKVQALGGDSAGVEYLRAIVLDKSQMYKPALAAYQKFLELSKDHHPDEEFKARQRIRVIQKELSKR